MAEKKTTGAEGVTKATYKEAVILQGGRQASEISEAIHKRTVATSMTQGSVTLRYAPRAPKASAPVDTAS
jgi:hypothetical protein